MPQLTFPLTSHGLEVPAWIGLNGTATAVLLAAGAAVPAPAAVRTQIDTGSTVTAVASWVLQQIAADIVSVGTM